MRESGEGSVAERKPWTLKEFGGKPVWEWLQLLIVPLALALLTVVFTWQQDAQQNRIEEKRAQAERRLAEQRAQDDAMQAYLDQMSSLLLDKDLGNSELDSNVRMLARARTQTILNRLDSDRRFSVLQFLIETNLVQGMDGEAPIVSLAGARLSDMALPAASLSGADLRRANLRRSDLRLTDLSSAEFFDAYLTDTNLSAADLTGADLTDADLTNANLTDANLTGADLSNLPEPDSDLTGADLTGADLTDANLTGANLTDANLTGANLTGADLSDADLTGADLSDVDLSGADLSDAKGFTNMLLEEQAASLDSATMPDGTKYP
jgi:uncharacterized protein YjbI with pentapeptide repeats